MAFPFQLSSDCVPYSENGVPCLLVAAFASELCPPNFAAKLAAFDAAILGNRQEISSTGPSSGLIENPALETPACLQTTVGDVALSNPSPGQLFAYVDP